MPLARVMNPYIKSINVNPSNVYAASPYRPYAGIFTSSSNVYSDQYNENFIRALSPFSVNDTNVIDAIRRKYDIRDNGAYQAGKTIGAVGGSIIGAGVSAYLYGNAISGLAGSAMFGGALLSNPIGWGILAAGTAMAITATIITSAHLGSAVGGAIASKEGSIAMGRYLSNLGNSLVTRPTTTVLNAATIFASHKVVAPLTRSPIVTQMVTMGLMKVVSPIGRALDNKMFGEMNEEEQMSYTDLLQLQGDMADDFSGTTFVKGALASIAKGKDYGSDLIAKAYGTSEDGFDPLDFMDVREAWGVDIGTFGNGIIDMMGEIVFDVDNTVVTTKNKTTTSISKAVQSNLVKRILGTRARGALFERYFEKVETKAEDGTVKTEVKAKDAFKNEIGSKQLQRVIENYLDTYKDPALAKTKEQHDKIVLQNTIAFDKAIASYRYNLIKKSKLTGKEANKLSNQLKDMVNESLRFYGEDVGKFNQNKAEYAKVFNKVTNAQKKSDLMVQKGMKQQKYNFDNSLLKEFKLNKFYPDSNLISGYLRLHPTFRTYALGNDNTMKTIGYFTRPVQSIISHPKVRYPLTKALAKASRAFDPFKKYTSFEDLSAKGKDPNIALTKEERKAMEEKTKPYREALNKQKKKYLSKVVQMWSKDPDYQLRIERLDKLAEEQKLLMQGKILTPEQTKRLEDLKEEMKTLSEKIKLAEDEAMEEGAKKDPYIKKTKMLLDKIEEKYKALEQMEEFFKRYEAQIRYVYKDQSGKEVKGIIDSKNASRWKKRLKELRLQEGYDKNEEYQQINTAMGFYTNAKIFYDGFTRIRKHYDEVLSILHEFEIPYVHDYLEVQKMNLTTHVFKVIEMTKGELDALLNKPENELTGEEKSQIEAIKKLEEDRVNLKKELALFEKSESTQQEILKRHRLNTEAKYNTLVSVVLYKLENSIFMNEDIKSIVLEDFQKDNEVTLPIFYATDFFSTLKLDEDTKYFFLNDEVLKDYFDNAIKNNPELQKVLTELYDIITFKNKTAEFSEIKDPIKLQNFNDGIKIIEDILKIANEKKTEENKKVLSDKDYNTLKKDAENILRKLILTQRKMLVDESTKIKRNAYTKKFSQLSENDMIDYVFLLYKKHNPLLKEEEGKTNYISYIDKLLYEINKDMMFIYESYIKDEFGEEEEKIFLGLKSNIKRLLSSKIINAMNSKYLRSGGLEKLVLEEKEAMTLKQQEIDKINRTTYTNEGKKTKEEIHQKMAQDFIDYFNQTIYKDLFKEMGIGRKEIEVMVAETEIKERIVVDGKIDETVIDNARVMAKNILNKIIINGKQFTSKQKKALENEIFKTLLTLANEMQNNIELEFFNKVNEFNKNSKERKEFIERFTNPFMKDIAGSVYSNFFDVTQLSKTLRGKVRKSDVKIVLERGNIKHPMAASIEEFFLTHKPSLENIMILKNQVMGTYTNGNGNPVKLERLSQFDEKILPKSWREFKYDNINKDLTYPLVMDFFGHYVPKSSTTEAYMRYNEDTFILPSILRDFFKESDITKSKDDTIKKEKDHFNEIKKQPKESSVANDLVKVFLNDPQIAKVLLSKEVFEVPGKAMNKVQVIRIELENGEKYDFYVPVQKEQGVFEINGNTYIKQKIYGENQDDVKYMDEVKKTFMNEFQKTKAFDKKNGDEFIAYKTQSEIFRIFHKQRPFGEVNTYVNDFVYMGKESTPYAIFVTKHMVRLPDGSKNLLITHSKEFMKELKDNKFFLDATQGDPKTVLEGIIIKDKNGKDKIVSMQEVFTPNGLLTEVVGRSALAFMARRMAKPIDNIEKPMLSTLHIKNNPELAMYEDIGANARTVLYDFSEDEGFKMPDGSQTYNGVAVVTRDFIDKHIKNAKDGMKFIDRYSSKHAIRIIEPDQYQYLIDKFGYLPDVVLSKASQENRGLHNQQAELSITKDMKPGEQKFVDNELRSLEHLKELAGNDLNETEGYLYIYFTDLLTDNDGVGYKASGDKGSSSEQDGAKISIEELQEVAFLGQEYKIEADGSKTFLDPNNDFYHWIFNQGIEDSKAIAENIYNDTSIISGKGGKFRTDFIERKMPNSGYNKIISDFSLKARQIKMPLEQALALNIIVLDKESPDGYKYVEGASKDSSRYGLVHRFPNQGRRSFIHVEILIDTTPGNKAIRMHPSLDAALNSDYDGDGVAVYSLKTADKNVMNASKNLFSHQYDGKSRYSDFANSVFKRNGKTYDLGLAKQEELNTDKSVRDITDADRKIKRDENGKVIPTTPKEKSFKSPEDNDNNLTNQKVLKEYSGAFKDVFNGMLSEAISDPGKEAWFKDFILRNPELKKLGIKTIYSFYTQLVHFYSQQTFDYSKHGYEYKKEAFALVYEAIKNDSKLSFREQMTKLSKIFYTDLVESAVRKGDEDGKLSIEQLDKAYLDALKLGIENAKVEPKDLVDMRNTQDEERHETPNSEPLKKAKSESFQTARKLFMKKLNKYLDEHGIQYSEKEIKDIVNGNKEVPTNINLGTNEESFKMDFNINKKPTNQIFKYILAIARDERLQRTKNAKIKTNEKILKPFYSRIHGYVFDLIDSYYQSNSDDINENGFNLLKNIKLVKTLKNGETVEIGLFDLIKVRKKLTNSKGTTYYKTINITEKNYKEYLNPNTLKKSDLKLNSGGNLNKAIALDKASLRTFKFVDKTGLLGQQFSAKTDELYRNLSNEVVKWFEDNNIGRVAIIDPKLHNQTIYEIGQYDSMYDAIINGTRGKSTLVDLLRDMGDQESIDALENIFKPFYINQSLNDFIDGKSRRSLTQSILNIDGILDPNNQRIDKVSIEEMRNFLIENQIITKEDTFEKFANDLYEALGIDASTDNLQNVYLAKYIIEEIYAGLPNIYGMKNDFVGTNYDDKLNYIVKIIQIKNGTFIKTYDKYKITNEDLMTMNVNKELDSFKTTEFYNIYNYVYRTIEESYGIDTKDDILKQLKSETERFRDVDKIINNLNRQLSRHIIDNVTIQNIKGEDTSIPFHMRKLMHPNNAIENPFVLRNTNKNRIDRHLNQRLYSLIYENFNKLGLDTDLTRELAAISNDYKISNDLLSLYLFESKNVEEYIKALEEQINLNSKLSIPLNDNLLKYFMHFNKISKQMNQNFQLILPDTIETFLSDMKYTFDPFRQNDPNKQVTMNDVYRKVFFDFFYELPKDQQDNLQLEIDKFVYFLTNTKSLSTLNMAPEEFVKMFFGKMLFSNKIYDKKYFDSTQKVDSIVERRLVVENIKKSIEELNALKSKMSLSDETTEGHLNEIRDMISSDRLVKSTIMNRIKKITDVPEEQVEIYESIKKYRKDLRDSLLDEKTEAIDTYEIAKYAPNGLKLKTYSLFNIYAQMLGKESFSKDELESLGKYLEADIKNSQNNLTDNNQKLHTAAIDNQLSFRVLNTFIEMFKRNKQMFDDNPTIKKLITDFMNDKQGFAFLDTENIVSLNAHNRFYEVSYIIFDENGNAIHKQHFLKVELDDVTINWLKEQKGYTDEDIARIRLKQDNIADFDYNKKVYAEISKDLKGKNIIGQSVKHSDTNLGDIEKLNKQINDMYLNQVRKTIKKNNSVANEFLKEYQDLSLVDLIHLINRNLKDGDKINSTKELHKIINVYKGKLREHIRDNYLFKGVEKVDPKETETYVSRITTMRDLFINETDPQTLKVKLNKLLNITNGLDFRIDDEIFNIIKDLYDKALSERIKQKNLFLEIPKLQKDKATGEYRIVETPMKKLEVGKLVYDSNDVFSLHMFRDAAFYDILEHIKPYLMYNGTTLSNYEYKERLVLDFDNIKFDKNIEGVSEALADAERYKGIDEILYMDYVYKAVKAQTKATEEDMIKDGLFPSDFKIDKVQVSQYEINNSRKAILKKVSFQNVQRYLENLVNKTIQDMYDTNKGSTTEVKENKAFKAKLNAIHDGLRYENFKTMSIERFSEILGVDSKDDIVKDAYKLLQDVHKDFTTNGFPFKFKDDDVSSVMYYKPELDNTFKELTFNHVMNSDNGLLRMLLDSVNEEDFDYAYNKLDIDYQKKLNEERIEYENVTEHNPVNQEYFREERVKIRNMILHGDFKSIEDYINERFSDMSKSKIKEFNKEYGLDKLKETYNEKMNELIKKGLYNQIPGFNLDSEGNFNAYSDGTRLIKYDPNNTEIVMRYKKAVINDMYNEINNVIYIQKYRTTADIGTDFPGKLDYTYYRNNIEKYGGKIILSDYQKHNKELASIESTYDYLFSSQRKSEELSKYQRPFYDVIEHLRIKGSNEYDIDRLFEELTTGFLSKFYRLTVITHPSEKEQENLDKYQASVQKENKKKLNKKIALFEENIKQLLADGDTEGADRVRVHIENLKNAELKRNPYYNEEKISEIRNAYPQWQSDDEIFKSIPAFSDTLDELKDTRHPTLKILELKNGEEGKQQLRELIKAGKDFYSLGFTSLTDLFNTNKMSYQEYKLPKAIKFLYSSIIFTQKTLMLANPGFLIRNIYDGFGRNHQLILNSDGPFSENYRFLHEAARTVTLDGNYKKFTKMHLESMKRFESSIKALVDMSESGKIDPYELEKLIAEAKSRIDNNATAVNNYLKKIISDEGQTPTKLASKNYTKFAVLYKNLTDLAKELGDFDVLEKIQAYTKDDRFNPADEIANIVGSYFKHYYTAGFFEQVVMNGTEKGHHMDFSDDSKENIEKVKDELHLMKIVNEIEKSGVIADRWEISGKAQAREIYKRIEHSTYEEFKGSIFTQMLNSVLEKNVFSKITGVIERWQRIHGVLLDTYVNGRSLDESMNRSISRFFNYGMKGAYEKSASVFFPFASFAVRNLDYYLDLMQDPTYIRYMSNVAQGMATWYQDDEENDYRKTNSFGNFTETQGWIPVGKNFGIKMGNAMFDAMQLVDNPVAGGQQKLNPVIQELNNMSNGEGYDPTKGTLGVIGSRLSNAVSTIANGNVQSPADVMPSLFYRRYNSSSYLSNTPYKYRMQYTTDYRNIYRDLFFPDGSRRTPSKNAFTSAKNIRYQSYRNALLMGAKR